MTEAEELFRTEAAAPTGKMLGWLAGKGISSESLASPLSIGVGKALFYDRHRYVPNRLGDDVLIFAIIDGGIVDLAAWAPKAKKIGTRLGVGACLGQGQIGREGYGTHGPACRVWPDPIDWLRANRVGIVICDPAAAAHLLAGMTIAAEDEHHAAELRTALVVQPLTIIASTAKRVAA